MSGRGDVRQRPGSFWQTVSAVAWSFLGIRRSSDHARDMAGLNPIHVIIAGILGALLFVAALVMFVHWIIGSGAAAS